LVREIDQQTQALHEGEIASATMKEKQAALSAALDESATAISALKTEKTALDEQLKTMETEIRGFAALHSDMAQSKETRSEDYKRMEDEYTKNAAQIEQKKAQLHDAEIRIAELFKENAALLNDNLRLGIEKQEVEKDNIRRKTTLKLNAETEENLCQLKTRLETLRAEKAGVSEGLKKQREEIAAKRDEAKKALSQTDEEIEGIRKDLNAISEKKMRTEFSIEKVESGIEAAQNRLWETYQLTYAGALPMRQEIDVSEAQTSVDNMKRRLRALGNVNPNAIEEYAELSERVRTLTTQRDDLQHAEQDLHTLITTLMSEMKKVFASSFEEINAHFKKTFKELFGGGRAELLLEDDQDIMESGIEIVAEPPGKKLQKISLLSGGEKALTAICLLFSLLKINPSPVCILDEIDAALDEANVYKFSDYLKKYAQNMQFIVITHRKPTMIICDSLYGFAMEEKGVSKLLSVRLD
jgi:chromosome segregation protein